MEFDGLIETIDKLKTDNLELKIKLEDTEERLDILEEIFKDKIEIYNRERELEYKRNEIEARKRESLRRITDLQEKIKYYQNIDLSKFTKKQLLEFTNRTADKWTLKDKKEHLLSKANEFKLNSLEHLKKLYLQEISI